MSLSLLPLSASSSMHYIWEAEATTVRRTMAATRACLVVALAFIFLEGAAAAAAKTSGWSSVQRGRQVHNFLRRLNKPHLATVKSPDGDIIDCVDMYKQPAFDDPLLENHTIQMQPSYHPKSLHDDPKVSPRPIAQTWHQNGKCPENTIPIRRTKEEDVLRAGSIGRYGKKMPRSIPKLISVHDPVKPGVTTGHKYAVASAPEGKYYGTKTNFNLWQPTISKNKDFSLAQLWISGGSYSNNDLNTIEVGWQVYPSLYSDSNTRIFIYWTRDGYQTTGCYNLNCPGFIQTNNQFAIGGSISPVSSYGGSQFDIDILIWKDPKGGNWWLQVGSYVVGYWPSSIFSYLANSASSVTWGGEVYSPNPIQTSTEMGSGHFPQEGFGKASYIRNIQVVGSSNILKSPDSLDLQSSQSDCYNVQNGSNRNWGTYIYYGGPGKNRNCVGKN